MVMEAKPSPLVVGREFVRQYYTLLHNSPDHLHRFYNAASSFTHKGWDPDASKEDVEDLPIVGQKNIHDKIQAMNFRDCHAKISHVDAQATLGDGVVVQVFGELSNDGHQMRRFTQTFVLACQSPKKYYVHNDIFRYHDIYCEDEDQQREEHEVVADTTTVNNDGSANAAPMIVQQSVFYAPPPANVIAVNASPALVPTGYPAAAVVQGTPAPPQVNGIMHEEMLKNIATQTSQTQLITAPSVPPQVLPMAPAPTALPIPIEPVAVAPVQEIMPINVVATTIDYEADQLNGNESDSLDNSKDTDATSSDEMVKTKSAPSPAPMGMNNNNSGVIKTWSNLVKTGPGLGFTGAPPQPEVAAAPQPQSFVAITQQQQQQAQQQKQAENYGSVDRRQPRQAPAPGDRERRISNNANNNNVNTDGSSQLFLGNLPTAATEEELRGLFSVFGKITDLRIHPKQTQKGGTGRPGPNYGFITFESAASATRLQEAQPIFYPTLNDKRGTKLNIENKIRKNVESTNSGRAGGEQNQDRGRNNNPGAGMNRNGSGGRSDRRGGDDRNRQFNRSERVGGGPGGPRQTNGNSGTFTNTRR